MSNLTFEEIIKYSPENQKVFEELEAKCIKGEIVPYVGAGISAFARFTPTFKGKNLFPTWEGLLKAKYEEYFSRKLPKDLIDAAEEIEREMEMRDENFHEYIRVTMGGDLNEETDWKAILENAKNEAISFIPKLFSSPIITTNFDQILEKYTNKKKVKFLLPFQVIRKNLKMGIAK
jgi:hypothetical protein